MSYGKKYGATASALLAFATFGVAPAAADGPFEPNETVASAAGPLTGTAVTGALETPQDIDWYAFYAHAPRQIGLLATIGGSCSSSTSGYIKVTLLDGDTASYRAELGTITLGRDLYKGTTVTANRVAFTSEQGHRYFIRAQQFGCQNTPYTLELAPGENLRSSLEETAPCTLAKAGARQAERRLARLRSAVKRARGVRRRVLRTRASLQAQEVVTASAAATSACERPAITGYPFT
jgi:hypothetical protein